ncbi:MAG: HDIG domain-containing protein [Candidatus Amulumruptor caecigallinarius]|nr:HDIG domain-containing protein [Candidatus Amulumruptor caecigallinarius]MCM1397668.1 HDIG domain-containing protein [Candidatus Amulumruptor caecigallinarius]MCM1454703.1 HDIG domain-containing protein [bacterium]
MKKYLLQVLLFIGAVFLTIYFQPTVDENHYVYEESRPWNYPLLTAPFDIPIHLDSVSARQVKDSIDATFQPVYRRNTAMELAVENDYTRRLTAATPDARLDRKTLTVLINRLKKLYDKGIVDGPTHAHIKSGRMPVVRFIVDNNAITASTGGYMSVREAYADLDSTLAAGGLRGHLTPAELAAALQPNIVYDSVESNRILQQMYQKAMAPVGVIQQGERIIDQGDIVTPQLYSILHTYEELLAERSSATGVSLFYPLLGQTLYVMVLLGAFYTYLVFFRRDYFDDRRVMTFMMVLLTGFALLTFLLDHAVMNGLYVMPLTILPIMVLIFTDSRTAMFIFIVETLICAPIATSQLQFIAIEFASGVAAITSIRELSKRSHLVRTALVVFVACSVTYTAVDVMHLGTLRKINPEMFAAFGFNALFISFAYFLIFIFEKVFGFTSRVTLVELSDINNQVLRELSEECPGTFQHSMSVSNLASAAAARIGANVQLVRAGALYHDIGKINNPAFFTENQYGVNPHDVLDPKQSARIVINHVTDGLKRAEKSKLPQVIRDFIAEHHGKGKAKYFYNTYCKAHPDEDVDPAPFTYPGPNPRSRETSLLMMADAVEAASRSLTDHSAEAITALVNRIIDSQIDEGLHSDSPISFREIKIVKESFIQRLRTIYHSRVSYPDAPARNSAGTPSAPAASSTPTK